MFLFVGVGFVAIAKIADRLDDNPFDAASLQGRGKACSFHLATNQVVLSCQPDQHVSEITVVNQFFTRQHATEAQQGPAGFVCLPANVELFDRRRQRTRSRWAWAA